MSDEAQELLDAAAGRESKPVPAADEVDRLDPVSEDLTLSTGTELVIQPLKARQFFRLLRIITRGGASVLPQMQLSVRQSEEEFLQNFLALIIFAIPEAEYETIEFVRSMVEPKGVPKNDEKLARQMRDSLDDELDNPELEDLISILELVVKREGSDLKALGKRLQKMFALAQKTGQAPKTSESPAS